MLSMKEDFLEGVYYMTKNGIIFFLHFFKNKYHLGHAKKNSGSQIIDLKNMDR